MRHSALFYFKRNEVKKAMNNKQLKAIKNHISTTGGATLDARGLDITTLKRGYMVSVKGFEFKTSLEALDKRTLERYQKIAQSKGAFVGLWLDAGVLYVDISKNIMQLNTALGLAKSNEQLAIFDNAKGASIYLQ